eukprot:6492067-Amphidinium_carterae.3
MVRKLPGFETFDEATEILHLDRPGTGLKDAPRAFSLKLRRLTTSMNFVQSCIDRELEFKFEQKRLCAAMAKHVDDIKMASTQAVFDSVIKDITAVFDGSRSIDQEEYGKAIKVTDLTGLPRSADTKLDAGMAKKFLSSIMTLAYMSITRPDIQVFTSALQRATQTPTLADFRKLNAVIKWLHQTPKKIVYKVPKKSYDTLTVFTDAGFSAEHESARSHKGMMTLWGPGVNWDKSGEYE